MRITGGEWASRRVAGVPRGSNVRPTPDALREQAFAVLNPTLRGASFLDLFAGTGVVSLEALSRGAKRAWLVERARESLRVIRHNFDALAVRAERFQLLSSNAVRAVEILAQDGVCCSVAWCDPPFAAWAEGVETLVAARDRHVLAAGAMVVLETPQRTEVILPGFETARRLRGASLLIVR